MPDDRAEEIKKLFNEFFVKIGEITAGALDNKETRSDKGKYLLALQTLFEVYAQELGYIDGISALVNIYKEDRDRTRNKFYRHGKQAALAGHKIICTNPNCPSSKYLEDELNAN